MEKYKEILGNGYHQTVRVGASGPKSLLQSTPVAPGGPQRAGLWGHLVQCSIISLGKRKGEAISLELGEGSPKGQMLAAPLKVLSENRSPGDQI